MRLLVGRDRHQRVALGVIVIEAARQSLAGVDREIKLELIAAAGGRVGPARVGDLGADVAVAEVERLAPCPLHARGAFEKARQLGQRDRLRLVEIAGGMPLAQQFHEGGRLALARANCCRSIASPLQGARTAGGGAMVSTWG